MLIERFPKDLWLTQLKPWFCGGAASKKSFIMTFCFGFENKVVSVRSDPLRKKKGGQHPTYPPASVQPDVFSWRVDCHSFSLRCCFKARDQGTNIYVLMKKNIKNEEPMLWVSRTIWKVALDSPNKFHFLLCWSWCMLRKRTENHAWGQHEEMLCRYRGRGEQKSRLSLSGISLFQLDKHRSWFLFKVLTYFFFPSSLARDLMEV